MFARRTWRIGSPLLFLFVLIAATLPLFGEIPAQTTVTMREMRFSPAKLEINTGETVTWMNEDIFSHTVTADDGSFDSGLIAPGSTWQHSFANAGSVGYHCRPHPNMAATVLVSIAAAQDQTSASLKWAPPTAPQQFHPILVNFTAALLPLAFLSDLLGRMFRRPTLHQAGWWMTLYAAVITPLTALAGWWWKRSAGADLPPHLVMVHAWLGSFAAFAFIGLAAWRWRAQKLGDPPSTAYLTCAFVLVLALVYQGSLGGRMLFGK
ncbi:Plastocyanin-like protein [Candidatus Koribacter versatilis Ellin345]|uniref:Plastocyanin-like protein n=1 Tax=Koribacter versatilis (strain Ellin345) TaxID=204669 RepID=Q1IQR1_KORVE|nr:DUF2231 domain-containing protein [Candidatus Koribacter versatilis]ABF40789.1 Plastocyanin-like protein [Candidatus Koribacter versatilis Ellin345]